MHSQGITGTSDSHLTEKALSPVRVSGAQLLDADNHGSTVQQHACLACNRSGEPASMEQASPLYMQQGGMSPKGCPQREVAKGTLGSA